MAHRNGSSASSILRDRMDRLTAHEVNVHRSSVRWVDADTARLERAAVMRLRGGHITLAGSNVGVASFSQGTLQQTQAVVVAGRSIACDEVRTVILAAPVVRGEVHALVDLRTAVALGVGFALGRAGIAAARALARRVARR